MDLIDLLYDNFIGVFDNVWYHRALFSGLLTMYFYTDIHNRFFQNEYKESESKQEVDFREMDQGSVRCCEKNENKTDDTENYTSDFISESESESEQESKSEKTLIKKHFKILKDIHSTTFRSDNYNCSYHYYCINNNIKLECCFCKICGNYICSDDTPSPKIMCSHYKLLDCVDARLDIFSGHIRTDDEEDVITTINSFFEAGDEVEMDFYKSRLRRFIYDEVKTEEEVLSSETEVESEVETKFSE